MTLLGQRHISDWHLQNNRQVSSNLVPDWVIIKAEIYHLWEQCILFWYVSTVNQCKKVCGGLGGNHLWVDSGGSLYFFLTCLSEFIATPKIKSTKISQAGNTGSRNPGGSLQKLSFNWNFKTFSENCLSFKHIFTHTVL